MTKREWIFVLVITLVALALYSFDLGSYKYAYVGDEWGFYEMARNIAVGEGPGLTQIFSESGVYGDGPMMDSFYQAAIMKVCGINNFGFRFSSVLAAVASLLPFYVFLRLAISARAAMAGTFCLCFSHYFMAWAHNGHNNNHIIFPMVLALCLFALAYKHGSRALFALCGLATGLSFYTYYTARLTLLLVLILFALWKPRRRCFLLFILVFAIAIAPLLLNGPAKLMSNVRGRWLGHDDWKTEDQIKKIAGHIGLSLVSPITFDGWGHGYFVAGTLFDPITTLLFVAGFIYAVRRSIKRRSPGAGGQPYAFLLLGYIVSAVAVGATTPYPRLSVTRQLILIPLVCMFAGVGADLSSAIADRLFTRSRAVRCLIVLAAGGCIIWLNLHRLYVEMPEKNGLHPLCLATKYVRESKGDMRYYYILPERISFWAQFQIEAYGLSDRVSIFEPGQIMDDPSCIVPPCRVIVSTLEPESVTEVLKFLKEHYAASRPEVVEGPPGGPWKIWKISDIYVIPIERARVSGGSTNI